MKSSQRSKPDRLISKLTQTAALDMHRSRHQRCSVRKGVLRNFAKLTEHLCQSLFFNKVTGLRPATLLKKRLLDRCFPVIFVKFLRTPFYTEHLSVAASVIMNKTKYCHAKLLSIYFCNKKIIEETIERL